MWSTGINRNIVECKVVILLSIFYHRSGINRNIVECKVFFSCFFIFGLLRINRNIVECKVCLYTDIFLKNLY